MTVTATELERLRGRLVGRRREELSTPALLVDLDLAERNTKTMAAHFRELPANLRPHIKVHKSPALARMAIDAGAVGVACATIPEVETMVAAGVEDVLLANQVVSPEKLAALAGAAGEARITVAVDDPRQAAMLSEAAAGAGNEIEVLVELDVGMGRCGVRSAPTAVELARLVDRTPHLRFRGMQAYEGHCMLEPDQDTRIREAEAANAAVIAAADAIVAAGVEVETISGGGTGTYFVTGANPRIDEVQAGTYVLMDAFHDQLVPGGFETAMTVLGTVISRQGDTVILDCGRKSVGIDFVSPPLRAYPQVEARYFAEEHGLFDFPFTAPYDLGDKVDVVAGYGPTTVNLHDFFHVMRGGVVVDLWPVAARGPGAVR